MAFVALPVGDDRRDDIRGESTLASVKTSLIHIPLIGAFNWVSNDNFTGAQH